MLRDYLRLISATQDGENANQRQHLDAIKEKLGFASLQSCIHSGFAYSM